MSLQAVTGQLYLIEGETQEETAVPGLLAQSAPSKTVRSRERDSLLIHLTLTGQPGETAVLAQDLLDTINQHFYATSGSVTSSLRQAILKANEMLVRLNLSGSGDIREGAITCAVLHNDELFVLQTGEGLALLGHNFGIERLPAKAPDRLTPLGRSAGLDIRYSHHRLETGDMLLLADPRLAHLPTAAFTPALVDVEIEPAMTELLDIVGDETGRFLLVEFTVDAPADMLSAVTQPMRRSSQAMPTVPTPRREPIAEMPTIPLTAVENTARKATSEAAMGLSRFTGWLAQVMGRVRPPRPETEEPVNKPIAASMAVIIPIVIALIVTGVYLQRGRVQRLSQIKTEMRQNMVLADEAGDDVSQLRVYYAAVLQLAAEADTLNPNDDDIADMRREIQVDLDRLDGVTRLTARPFHTYPESVELTAVVLRDGFNGGLYTLDGANSNVFQHDTDESYVTPTSPTPKQIIFRDQAVGTYAVSNIVDMMWRPRGTAVTREGLAMLDSGGALLTHFPDFEDTRAIPLGCASEWQFPTEITDFDERLYVLDNGRSVIWKYFPDGDGYLFKDDEQIITFNDDPDLAHVRDMAIYSEDGSLVLVYDDGRVRYYDTRSGRIQWDQFTLLQNGLTLPIIAPTAVKMIGPGLNASIFVADPGSGRIIQISRGGLVLAQYRAADANGLELFATITDFAIAETPLRIFVTSGNTLFAVTQE
jgi:hypothetical protein